MGKKKKPELIDIIVKIDNRKLADQFLKDILTPSERKEIESRWELVKMLEEGKSQRQIADELGVSLCKITRGSRELQYGTGSLKKLLKK